ncbi:MAG: DUF3306 domain-containing protein [Polaromonas sp.]|nr:DUF3306 domain-containing protein [Polaromonas sp.]
MAEESTGFLGRWARRKTDVLQGKPIDEPAAQSLPVHGVAPATASVVNTPAEALAAQPVAATEPPPLSLEDVKLLTKDSDFKPFMAQNVGSDVRNAAMKKLFADPHFNVMDGLDIYIDDYSKSDPIPEEMLRQMTSSKFLKLFDDEEDLEKPDAETPPRENANNPTDQTVAQSYDPTDIAEPDATPQINSSHPELLPDGSNSVASQTQHVSSHDYPDLRLQPDHTAPAPKAWRGA